MFVGMLSFSIAVVNKVEIGLDQRLSMPDVRIYLFTPFAHICILKSLERGHCEQSLPSHRTPMC